MHSKLAGHLNLQELITGVIQDAREKVAAVEEKDKKKGNPFAEKADKTDKEKSPFPPKKDNDHDEDDKEKKSSVIDIDDSDEVEKLAAALDEVGTQLMSKEADSVNIGGEKPQGGTVVPTNNAVGGKQNYGKDKSKSHNVPAHTPEITAPDDKGAKTLVEDTLKGGHIPITKGYPAKGVLKVGEAEKSSASVTAIKDAISKTASAGAFKPMVPGGHGKVEGKDNEKDKGLAAAKLPMVKKSSAVDFILNRITKVAESTQGGMTLDSPSESGPKPETNAAGGNDARSNISSAKAAIDMKKVDGKKPQKRMLSEVLTEPALSKAHDAKVQENLRNASKGGVKIAASKAFLQKIASDPSDPRFEKLKLAMKKNGKKEKDANTDSPTPNPTATSM